MQRSLADALYVYIYTSPLARNKNGTLPRHNESYGPGLGELLWIEFLLPPHPLFVSIGNTVKERILRPLSYNKARTLKDI